MHHRCIIDAAKVKITTMIIGLIKRCVIDDHRSMDLTDDDTMIKYRNG